MSDKKQVILTIDNVRIKEYDSMNVVVERYEEYTVPPKKKGEPVKVVSGWKFKGYYNSILSALLFIQRKELLIDYNVVSDLESYLEQVDESNAKLLEVMKE